RALTHTCAFALRLPPWRHETTLAVGSERDIWRLEVETIPKFARHLLVLLIEGLAVVRELAAPDRGTVTGAKLQEPVRIGERLARGRHEIGVSALENRLGLRELAEPTSRDDRRGKPGRAHRRTDRSCELGVAREWSARVGIDRRHALVARLPGVRVCR